MSGYKRKSDVVKSWQNFDKKVEEITKNNSLTLEEKGYSAELNNRGVKSYFEEQFDKVLLQDQILPIVGPFEDITITQSFQTGRKRGQFLVENGYTEEIYHNKYLPEFEQKYEKISKHR